MPLERSLVALDLPIATPGRISNGNASQATSQPEGLLLRVLQRSGLGATVAPLTQLIERLVS